MLKLAWRSLPWVLFGLALGLASVFFCLAQCLGHFCLVHNPWFTDLGWFRDPGVRVSQVWPRLWLESVRSLTGTASIWSGPGLAWFCSFVLSAKVIKVCSVWSIPDCGFFWSESYCPRAKSSFPLPVLGWTPHTGYAPNFNTVVTPLHLFCKILHGSGKKLMIAQSH